MSKTETLKAILATNAFDQLTPFKEPSLWESMTPDEREMLGILFVKQGEHQLQQGDSEVLKSFDLASKVAPHSPTIFFRQALIFAAQGQNIRCLIAASEALSKAVELNPRFVSAWHSWGNVLLRMGLFYENPDYLSLADEKFAKAESLASESPEGHVESLYWHWGVCWYNLGKFSGEAVDFYRSLEKFRLVEHEIHQAEFHNDYGNALVDLATLIGREELFLEAIDQYEKAAVSSPLNHEGWFNLACTYQRLYNFSLSKDYFIKSDECFESASDKNGEEASIWLRWAELYLVAGKMCRDTDRLSASFEKFTRADALEPDNPHIILRWGEALMTLASLTENLEMLRDAEAKISFALKALPKSKDAWYVYGLCQCEYGRYFASKDYYLKAIEKFRHGLELKESDPMMNQGLAMAYFAIGELSADAEMMGRSIAYFNQAAELAEIYGRLTPQFLSDWGVALMKLGELTNDRSCVEKAASKFEEAINGRLDAFEGDEIELEWLYNYGCAMDFLGDFHDEPIYYEKSVQVLTHVLKLDPDYIHARYNLALALAHLGEINSDVDCFHHSIEQFQIVIDYDPEDEIAWNDYGMAFLNLALLTTDPMHKENSRFYYESAEQKILQSISLGSIHAYYNLACLYALTDRPLEAIQFLEKAEQCNALPPTDDVIHDEWLDGLRDHQGYRMFIARLLNKQDHGDPYDPD